MLRAGPLLVEGCMRPWAERLLDLTAPRPGDRCLDVLSESDVIARRLQRAVGPGGAVVGVDDGDDIPPGRWSIAVSLFGLAAAAGAPRILERVDESLHRGSGRLAVAVWAGAAGAPHEAAVRAGLAEVGQTWPQLDAELHLGDADITRALPTSLRWMRLADVVRFDGIAHLWAALVDERDPPPQLTTAPPAAIAEAASVCAARLRRYTAADGTLRIPVEALVATR